MQLVGSEGRVFRVHDTSAGNKFLSRREARNLELLWNREAGTVFYDDNGHLRVMNCVEKFFHGIFCYISKDYAREKGDAVNRLITDLTNHFSLPNTELLVDPRDYADFIQTLFFEKLAPLSRTVYKRAISADQERVLKAAVVITDEQFSPDADGNFRAEQTEAVFWAKMGSFTKREGSSVSYEIIRATVGGIQGRSLGLFKPKDREPFSPENPKTLQKVKMWILDHVLPCLWGSLREINGGSGYIAEEASYKLSLHFQAAIMEFLRQPQARDLDQGLRESLQAMAGNQPLVPQTHVASFEIPREGEQKGSFQLWINQPFEELHTVLDLNRHYKRRHWFQYFPTVDQLKERFPQEFFELMFIFDFIVANSDRHGENCFVHRDEQQAVTGMRLIDAGRSFPPRAPRPWHLIETRSLYQWERLPLTEEGFSDFGKFMITYLKQHRDPIIADLKQVYERHEEDEELTQGRLAGVRERLSILNAQQDSTVRSITGLKTQEDFTRFFAAHVDVGQELDEVVKREAAALALAQQKKTRDLALGQHYRVDPDGMAHIEL
jgi:hypothetical protein